MSNHEHENFGGRVAAAGGIGISVTAAMVVLQEVAVMYSPETVSSLELALSGLVGALAATMGWLGSK